MSHPTGTQFNGVRTVDGLRDRCHVDDITGCWIWRGGLSGGRPILYLPALQRVVTLGTAIAVLKTGVRPARGVAWHCTCETPNCANPGHRVEGNRSSQMLAAKLTKTPIVRARIAAAKAHKLTHEKARDIRESTEPLRVVAARHGVSISTCSHIRRGEQWREVGVSAFSSWGRP